MTEDEAKQHTPESANNLPWDYPGFIICPGRYYYGQAHMEIEPHPMWMKFGGDITFLIWRFEKDPKEWYLTYRFRYNASKNNSPWDYSDESGDRKKWHAMRGLVTGPGDNLGDKVKDSLNRMVNEIGASMPGGLGVADWLMVQGDVDKFMAEVIRQKKPWMHFKFGEKRN